MSRRILIVENDMTLANYISGLLPKEYFDSICMCSSVKASLNSVVNDNINLALTSTGPEGMGFLICAAIKGDYKYGNAADEAIPPGKNLEKLSLTKRYRIGRAQRRMYAQDFFDGDEKKAGKLLKNYGRLPIILMQDHIEDMEYPITINPESGFSGIVRSKPRIENGEIHYGPSSSEEMFRGNLHSEIKRCI